MNCGVTPSDTSCVTRMRGEDTSESGGSGDGELGEMHGAAFDAVVDAANVK
jgi:hypothetical protein